MKTHYVENMEQETIETAPESETVTAVLKWFNQPKGFGFVVPENEDVDAFIHITTLQRADIQGLNDGATLRCEIQRGNKGALVTNVLELLDEGQPAEDMTPREAKKTQECYELAGSVKWFKTDKGFGFITPDDGMKDIFIHKTCLERHGLEDLRPGQGVNMVIKDVEKGREVISFEITEAN